MNQYVFLFPVPIRHENNNNMVRSQLRPPLNYLGYALEFDNDELIVTPINSIIKMKPYKQEDGFLYYNFFFDGITLDNKNKHHIFTGQQFNVLTQETKTKPKQVNITLNHTIINKNAKTLYGGYLPKFTINLYSPILKHYQFPYQCVYELTFEYSNSNVTLDNKICYITPFNI